jgi:3-oxoacyl-[acyl-carrier protein] reductase
MQLKIFVKILYLDRDDMKRLKSKTALVTGASKGIGRGIAIEMAKEGANVAINYSSDTAGAQETLDAVKAAGADGIIIKADVGSKAEVDAMVNEAIKTFGQVDILVNNAGIALWKPFLELDEENWDKTIDTNLKSVFLCSQAVAKDLIKKKAKGSIINISSIAAHGAMDCLVPYCASKGGMTLITKAIATELGPYGIRVNSLAPGTIDIERNSNTDPDYPGDWIPYIPLGRVGTVEEVAKAVIFLACEDSSYITAQTFWADGGETSYVPMPRADFARDKNLATEGTEI